MLTNTPSIDKDDRVAGNFNLNSNAKVIQQVPNTLSSVADDLPMNDDGTLREIGEVAKLLNIKGAGPRQLFTILREEEILIPNSRLPYQEYIDEGWFEVAQIPWKNGFKMRGIDYKPVVTTRGIKNIREIVLAHLNVAATSL